MALVRWDVIMPESRVAPRFRLCSNIRHKRVSSTACRGRAVLIEHPYWSEDALYIGINKASSLVIACARSDTEDEEILDQAHPRSPGKNLRVAR